jgi:hypothetical protein
MRRAIACAESFILATEFARPDSSFWLTRRARVERGMSSTNLRIQACKHLHKTASRLGAMASRHVDKLYGNASCRGVATLGIRIKAKSPSR